jgi:hypothetical protein
VTKRIDFDLFAPHRAPSPSFVLFSVTPETQTQTHTMWDGLFMLLTLSTLMAIA